jgi:hypothetical protein
MHPRPGSIEVGPLEHFCADAAPVDGRRNVMCGLGVLFLGGLHSQRVMLCEIEKSRPLSAVTVGKLTPCWCSRYRIVTGGVEILLHPLVDAPPTDLL